MPSSPTPPQPAQPPTPPSPPTPLAALAHACGVATEFTDWRGQHVTVDERTVVAVLAALGIDASTPRAAEDALEARRVAEAGRLLPPCVVTRAGAPADVLARVPAGSSVEVWVTLEDGGPRRDLHPADGDPAGGDPADGDPVTASRFALPADLPLGWHQLHARTSSAGQATVPLVVTPAYLPMPAAVGNERSWGFMTQLYSVRSAGSWGLGDLADLAELARWSGTSLGAGFVLVNPLHAAQPVPPMEPSPYFPSTRRFTNPVYLRIEHVPEVVALPAEDRARVQALASAMQVRNTSAELLDRDAVWAAKRAALELAFTVPRSADRQAAFDAYRAREGRGLEDFAIWWALCEQLGARWRDWPEPFRDPSSDAVTQAREQLAGRVEFASWLQFLADEQLAAAQQAATDAGMPLGVVHDLAVGVSPDGADAWALQDVLAVGVTTGAPPDAFNQQGQDWRQPPWRPDRLAETGYAAYRDMVRAALRHGGGVRVDHILGLFRLWWVPEASSPAEGTYVAYDHEALVGILALEAYRHGAVVVGEDLGTVQPWVRDVLADRGLLGTSVLWFERDKRRRPLAPERWRRACLATVTTHDLPPTAGYLAGEHVRLRADLGLLTRPVKKVRAADEAERDAWSAALRSRGLVGAEPTDAELVVGLHGYLARTPARMLGVALPDVAGERRTQNQPGTVDEYPNWRVPLADGDGRPVLLDEVAGSARAEALAQAVAGVQARQYR